MRRPLALRPKFRWNTSLSSCLLGLFSHFLWTAASDAALLSDTETEGTRLKHQSVMLRYKSSYSWAAKLTWKPPEKTNAMEGNAPHGAQWCNELVHYAVIDRSDQIIFLTNGHFPSPRRERKRESVAEACTVPIIRDTTLIWLIYSNRTTVWDNHHMEGFSTISHSPNRRDENVLFMEACLWKDSVATRQKSICNWSVGLSSVLSTVWSVCCYHNVTYEVKSIVLFSVPCASLTCSLKRQDTKGWLISAQRKEMH